MAFQLRPWNTHFIKLCSVRYGATFTGIESAKTDAKSVVTGVQCGEASKHEVEVMQQYIQHVLHVHNLPEVFISHHTRGRLTSREGAFLSKVPAGSSLHTLALETKKLTGALLPCFTGKFSRREEFQHDDPLQSFLPLTKLPGSAKELCLTWSSDFRVEEKQKENPSFQVKSTKLDNKGFLDPLFIGNIFHPVSYTADDMHSAETTWSPGHESSFDELPGDILCECEKTDICSSEKFVKEYPSDLLLQETTPITVVPFEPVTKDMIPVHCDIQTEVCEISCDTSIEKTLSPKSVSSPVDSDVVENYLCSAKMSSGIEPPKNSQSSDNLLKMKEKLEKEFQNFFVKMHDYSLYHKEMVFENNYWGEEKVYRGINAYAWELNKIKFLSHFKFSNVKFHILRMTHHEEDNTIKVRWRVNGLPTLTTYLKFWKFLPGKYSNAMEHESEWHDGFSIFYLGKDGLIQKHRIDRWMLDEERVVPKKTGVAATLAILIGLIPRPSLGDLNSFMMTHKKPALPPSL
ncbi:uncharacterized protein LOC135501356 isoform X2 [Lineus longissimus]|uniref:uncharacterized protein LOC135501356 isoform X2 n=1 Tax=Lineus longissimus TaxID=88925 RepID=UPI002B4D0D9B